MTVLRDDEPRVLGGQDQQSGGTWLALNEWGVFAGLTNQPRHAGRDATRRTRGELPLALTAQPDASRGVEEFLARHHPADYNGSWLLTGDPDALFFIDFTGLVEPVAVTLAPGLHVLENRALGVPSPKAERVAASLAAATDAATALTAFRRVLGDHTVAEPAAPTDQPGPESPPPRGPRPIACTSTSTAPAPRVSSAMEPTGRTCHRRSGWPTARPARHRSSTSAACGPRSFGRPDDTFPRRHLQFAHDQLAVPLSHGGETQRPVEA